MYTSTFAGAASVSRRFTLPNLWYHLSLYTDFVEVIGDSRKRNRAFASYNFCFCSKDGHLKQLQLTFVAGEANRENFIARLKIVIVNVDGCVQRSILLLSSLFSASVCAMFVNTHLTE